ncbi:ferredoxin [Mycobacterium arosiense]|uniref:Ferredoxin n=1 Tax=Mycobacterium arosiense ATCC BAA-1401 = DSM 45069 TaxID=1265311 RepID=A0A1W9ZCL2_MYCAI|nr:ferredoxin [Mycobacterium arosiense]ORA11972.1 hypothetical protein BST14_17835 [Mycobacterium arosiense ATCC BAA-1401 = DSM 45069]
MKLSVDPTRCQGIGLCAASAPELFAIGGDGQSEVLRQPGADELGAAEEAFANCPTAAVVFQA